LRKKDAKEPATAGHDEDRSELEHDVHDLPVDTDRCRL
jgi:hypothetical protein